MSMSICEIIASIAREAEASGEASYPLLSAVENVSRPPQLEVLRDWSGSGDVVLAEKMLCPTEGRHGQSRNRRSVVHAIALRDISERRYKRRRGDLLCRNTASWGILGLTGYTATCPDCADRISKLGLRVSSEEGAAKSVTIY